MPLPHYSTRFFFFISYFRPWVVGPGPLLLLLFPPSAICRGGGEEGELGGGGGTVEKGKKKKGEYNRAHQDF